MSRVKFNDYEEYEEYEQPKSILKSSERGYTMAPPVVKKPVIKPSKKSSDIIPDYTKLAVKEGEGCCHKCDENFHNHYIKPCQTIGVIGPTGSGKSNWVVDFINRKNNVFYEIIYFTGSTADEALLNLLKKHIEGIEIIDDVDNLPILTDYNDSDKSNEKLIIFDDVINLTSKQLKEIQKFFNSGRKYGFTMLFLAQNYTNIPTQIRRNLMMLVLFRMNDNTTISNILRNHSSGEEKEIIKRSYFNSTASKGQCFIIDFGAEPDRKYRSNFTTFLSL